MPGIFIARVARVSQFILVFALVLGAFSLLSPVFAGQGHEDLPALSPSHETQARRPEVAAVEGWVTVKSTGRPVSGASVRIGSHSTVARSDGYFSFTASALGLPSSQQPNTFTSVRVEVNAASFAVWQLEGARFYHGDTLRLYPKLEAKNQNLAPNSESLFSYAHGVGNFTLDERVDETGNFGASSTALTPPATIRVYRTATGVVEVIPFREYIKHVLPNEWVPSWGAESLKAGAMAVKSYAWYWMSLGGKQVALGADVKDNVDDQVYDPNVSYASTDAAVDATFNYAITRGGTLFQAQYCAGNYRSDSAGDCPWPSQYMTQWGSAYHADQGRSWGWILQFYYSGSTITPSPPGGGYTGPPPTEVPSAPRPVPPGPPATGFDVGQGSARADVFQAAFVRNGGADVLGSPVGPVRWWMQYVSEFNVVAQPFSGPDGRGNIWLIYDVLKATDETGHRAFLLSGDIATTYSEHNPPGPEWIGAPTSDPYIADTSKPTTRSQGFRQGTLVESNPGAQFVPMQDKFSGWKAEFFVGRQSPAANLDPLVSLPGQPAAVRELATIKLDWPAAAKIPQTVGVGQADWSAQFTKVVDFQAATYDFTLRADSGVRLWVDGLLAVNGWNWDSLRSENYAASMTAGRHTIRVQYYSPGPGANLDLNFVLQGTAVVPPPPLPSQPDVMVGQAAIRVRVQWLGRQAAPADNWVMPLTLLLSNPGDAKVLSTYRGMTDRNGAATFQGLPSGVYNVHVKGAHSLQSARASITLSNNTTTDVDMKAQVEGDTDGDNCVTVADFAFVQSMIGAHKNTPGFNPAADLNGDGVVSMTDVSLLRSGFDRCGDISADDEFQPLAILTGQTLSQEMSPWLNTDQLQKGLGMSLVSSSLEPRQADVIEVRVQATTGSQAVDGASFLVRYDPTQLAPVDASGRPARAVEPGIALPSVLGNWTDSQGGLIGYSAGMLQGAPPSGEFTIAILRFRLIGNATSTSIGFDRGPVGAVQLTNGGTDLLGQAVGLTLNRQP